MNFSKYLGNTLNQWKTPRFILTSTSRLNFGLLIGYPLKKDILWKPWWRGWKNCLRHTYLLPQHPMAKHYPNHEPFNEVKLISPFVSPKLACEIERPSLPSLKPKPCPSGHQNVVLDKGRDSMSILHAVSFEKQNFYAMDILLSTECSYEDHNLLLILVCFHLL